MQSIDHRYSIPATPNPPPFFAVLVVAVGVGGGGGGVINKKQKKAFCYEGINTNLIYVAFVVLIYLLTL